MNSIKTKLLLYINVLILLAIITTVGSTIYMFSQYNEEITQQQAFSGMMGLSKAVEQYKKESLNRAEMFSEYKGVPEAIESKDTRAVLDVLAPLVEGTGIDFATITDEMGIVIARTHDPAKMGDSVINQKNVQVALKGESIAVVESGTVVKLSARSGVPVRNDHGQLVGVISVGYDLSKEKVVDEIKDLFSTDATLFLKDTRVNTTIIKDNQRQIGTQLDPVIATKVLNENQKYIGNATILGESYVTAYMPLVGPDGKNIGIIFAGKTKVNALAMIKKISFIVFFITLTVLIIAIILTIVMTSKTVGPIKNLADRASQMATGNLAVDKINFNSRDELGQLAQAFNSMHSNLCTMVEQLKVKAVDIVASSNQLSASAQNVTAGSNETANSVNQIVGKVEQVNNNTRNAADVSSQATIYAREGQQCIQRAEEQMMVIEQVTGNSQKVMSELNQSTEQINRIIDFISQISGQTNLLALNAAIEAARAGEHGRGFSVVAEEVKKLAEQSSDAAKEIGNIIRGIQQGCRDAVQSMNQGTVQVQAGTRAVKEAGVAFENIIGGVESLDVDMIAVATAIDQISSSFESVAAATEEQTASMEEVSSTAQNLARIAEELEGLTLQFQIKG